MTSPDLAAAVDLVVTRLNDAGVKASPNPEDVEVPGAWVDFTGQVSWTMRGVFVGVEVNIVVPANDRVTALAGLQTLLDDVVEELGTPDGDARKQGLVLPDNPAPLPSLALPYLVSP